MARGSIMGAAPGNGAISRLGHRAKEHPVLLFVPVIDFLLLSLGRAARPRNCNGRIASAADYTPLLVRVRLVVVFFPPGHSKQAVCGYAASRPRALRVVESGSTPIA